MQKGYNTLAKELAFIITMWNRVGFKLGNKSVVLRDDVIHSASNSKFWQYYPLNKSLVFSSFHMSDETIPKYITKIREFKPDFIQAYPSVITILARFMKKNNIEPFQNVKAILCTSENLDIWQIDLLKDVFKCRIWDFYGHTERAALAGQCEVSSYYHIQSEYGIVELIGNNNKSVNNENEICEIIATGFNNFACPFIRYCTMDSAVPINAKCECGRNYKLLRKIEGRIQDFIVTNNGSLITLGPVMGGIHEVEFVKVKQIQLLQEVPGKLIIQVVKKDYSCSDVEIEKDILKIFRARFKRRCELSVRFVNHIPLTRRGKYRYLIQKLPIKFSN